MRLRQQPADFRVEEIIDLRLSEEKEAYRIYRLEKRGTESFDLLDRLSQRHRIPRASLGISGLKDMHAITTQYLSIPAGHELTDDGIGGVKISFLGYSATPITLGDHLGNRFEITIRNIRKNEMEGISQRVKVLLAAGVPNYFDSQRFGSVSKGDYIMRRVIRKDYEGAIKLFLTSPRGQDANRVAARKQFVLDHWSRLLQMDAHLLSFSPVLRTYCATGSWLAAYKRIPPALRELFVSSYQSYLWNECAKRLLTSAFGEERLCPVPYKAGRLLFPLADDQKAKTSLPASFKTISDRANLTTLEAKTIEKVLAKEKLTIRDFNIRKATGNFFKSHDRTLFVKPDGFSISPPAPDDLAARAGNPLKVTVRFSLPKGSYATIVLKALCEVATAGD